MSWWSKNKGKIQILIAIIVLALLLIVGVLMLLGPLLGSYYCADHFC
jgi:hypothetical protein